MLGRARRGDGGRAPESSALVPGDEGGWGGGLAGRWGGGPENKRCHFLGSLKNLTIDLAGDEGGVGGRRGGGGPARRATRGGTRVHCFHRKTGEGGPGRRARGDGGRGTREQFGSEAGKGQQGVHWFHLLGSLKNLTIGLIW